MASKLDDKMKVVTFIGEDRLTPVVEQIKATIEEGKVETLQVQINTKGYENRKDPKMTKEIRFPYFMRRDPETVVIGNEAAKAIAEANNIPFALISEYEGNTDSQKKRREKFIKKFKYFILCPGYNKAFNLKEILMKKKTHFMCTVVDNLPKVYEECRFTYKLKIKDWFCISFPVGHTGMPTNEIVENLQYGIQLLADNLKKGPLNIKDCFIKRTNGENIKLY